MMNLERVMKPQTDKETGVARVVYERDTLEFARITTLFDGVFAIAMTLLVVTLEIPDVPADGLGRALAAQIPQIVTLILSFALVSQIWWEHHKLLEMFALLEPVMVGINLALLGVVILVPYATGLIGNAYTSRAAVMPFIALFIVINLLIALLTWRAHRMHAWRRPVTDALFAWLVSTSIGGIVMLLVAMILAIWFPVISLVILALGTIIGPLVSRLSYRE
jgi:uncharacterized membrane protein